MTGFSLKLIAIATMFIDHAGYILYMYDEAVFMRYIGRIAFPIFAFLIAEGCKYTGDIKKYTMRLFVFALISQVPFALFTGLGVFGYKNIFFTLGIAVLCIMAYKVVKEKYDNSILHIAVAIILCFVGYTAANELWTDFGGRGVVLIILLYLSGRKEIQLVVLLSFMLIMYSDNMGFLIGGMASIIPIALYNRRQGYKANKWLFYGFYPMHLLLLVAARYIFL